MASHDSQATAPRPRRRHPSTRAVAFTLRVIEGSDHDARFRIEPAQPGRVLIGKSPSCDLQLRDEAVSRRHLAAELTGDGLRLTDLGSTNGTRVGGLAIVEVIARGGEQVALGDTVLVVERGAQPSEAKLPAATSFGRTIGASPAMRKLFPLCHRLAGAEVPIIIEGETGTGKEVLAESLHEASARAGGPFVVFDCTTIPSNLIESALFGHERGAFTGATEARKGVFEQADGGTLLLDEIGDLDLELQAKLLRALERREVQRVGSSRWRKVDVRILAATRRDLDAEVQAGRFRDDLFYRLAVTRIELPPLRRREGDIRTLARHFHRRIADAGSEPDEGFMQRLESYGWPGNVRELQNAVARQVALGDLADLSARGLAAADAAGSVAAPASAQEGGDRLQQIIDEGLPFPRARRKVVELFEQLYLERVLDQYDGNVARAAAAAGVARRYFRLLRARNRERTGQ